MKKIEIQTTARRYAFLGDWNESPSNHGTWTTNWLARNLRGHVEAPPKGKHGRIDHVVTNCDVLRHYRIDGGGSDHGIIVAHIADPMNSRRRLAIMYWNVERDRNDEERKEMYRMISNVIREHNIDVVCLQETADYWEGMASFFRGRGWAVVGSPDRIFRHNMIAVRSDHGVKDKENIQLSRHGWFLRSNNSITHAPTGSPFCTVDGWAYIGSIHMVAGVRIEAGKVKGPLLRRRVWRQMMTRLLTIGRQVINR